MLPIYHHKMDIIRAHQILWNRRAPLEGHLRFLPRFYSKEAMIIVTACFLPKEIMLSGVLT